MRLRLLCLCCFFSGLLPRALVADLANPATFSISEIKPSHFTVELTLPIINGRTVKVQPVLPDICVIEGDPEIRVEPRRVIRTWVVECAPEKLAGAPIGLHGLLGTSLEILFNSETLDGRRHTAQLRGTHSYTVIPAAPFLPRLLAEAGRTGTTQMLRQPEALCLLLVLLLGSTRIRSVLWLAGLMLSSQAIGQWLHTQKWLLVSPPFVRSIAAAIGVAICWRLLNSKKPGFSVSLAGMVSIACLLGILYGGVGDPAASILALSSLEQHFARLCFAAGALLAMAMVALAFTEIRAALRGHVKRQLRTVSPAVLLLGISTMGLLLYEGSGYIVAGGVAPQLPVLSVVGFVAIALFVESQGPTANWMTFGLAALGIGAGVALGLWDDIPRPTSLAVMGTLAGIGLMLWWPSRALRGSPLFVLLPFACLQAFHATSVLQDTVAYPASEAVALGVALLLLFVASRLAWSGCKEQKVIRLVGLAILVLALVWRGAEYPALIGGTSAADIAMGVLPVPLLSLVLAGTALLAWPRRRRFQAVKPSPVFPVSLLLLGFFLLPVAGIRLPIPFYTPRAPGPDQAGAIAGQLLTETYLAFNIAEEDEAFDRLAEALTDELVADVYLDSRRRLTAGTREGAVVTVKNVQILKVGHPLQQSEAYGFTYPCTWSVTSRVRHWQHLHSRQNTYSGQLTIRIDDARWRISGLTLQSEEREILTGATA